MADAPDLSKVIGIIMEHPEIIGQISALVGKDGATDTEPEAVTANAAEGGDAAPVARVTGSHASNRARLLGAMKPYLSEGRARAIETMITVTDILESMKRGG